MNNYQAAITEAISKGNLILPPAGSVTLLHVYHDEWCGSHHGKPCDCNPDIVQVIRPTDMPGKIRKRHDNNTPPILRTMRTNRKVNDGLQKKD